jgi:hypothetical protein
MKYIITITTNENRELSGDTSTKRTVDNFIFDSRKEALSNMKGFVLASLNNSMEINKAGDIDEEFVYSYDAIILTDVEYENQLDVSKKFVEQAKKETEKEIIQMQVERRKEEEKFKKQSEEEEKQLYEKLKKKYG